MLRPFLAASCLCAATVAKAEPARLSGSQIRTLVTGATVEIDAPLGARLPIHYERDGKLAGQARELAPYLGAASDTGRWWISSDQLCHKWKQWFSGEPQCFRLTAEGRRVHWSMPDGNTGTATITIPAPVEIAAAPAEAPKAKPAPPTQAYASAAMLPLASAQAAPPKPAPKAHPAPANVAKQSNTGAPHAASPSLSAAHSPKAAVADSAWLERAPQAPAPKAHSHNTMPNHPAPAKTEPKRTAELQAQPKLAPQPQAKPTAWFEAPFDTQPAMPKRAAQPGFMVVHVASDDVLNVRSGPSAEHDVVGELQPGSRGVAITGACRSKWCPVAHRGASGWVNSAYLIGEDGDPPVLSDARGAPRDCLTPAARALLHRIEERFGPVQVISTCRPGATIAGTSWPSRHASGNAVDFNAGHRKAEIVEWLVANHRDGGTMTYPDMDHIHVDIGRHFVSLAGSRQRGAWRTD